MKHRLQWKIVGIMFISMFLGITAMAVSQAIVFQGIYHMSAEESEEVFAEQSVYFNFVFIGITIIVFFLLSRRVIRRIEVMNENIQRIAVGRIHGLCEDEHRDELGDLSEAISRMANQIEESWQKEQSMICSIAHDLRTPITSIQGYAERLCKEEQLSPQGKMEVEVLLRKSRELSEQVSELLEYSVLTFQENTYEMTEISLSQLLEQVLIDFIPMLEKEGMQFALTGNQKPYLFQGNQSLLIRLFENLIMNSIRYGKNGKCLEVDFSETEKDIMISFSNYGTIITKQECIHIFDAFYQREDAEQYTTESKGLGLSIVKEIVDIHKGKIEVICHEELQKVTFQIQFSKTN